MNRYITVRELANKMDFEVVGKLKRVKDKQYGIGCNYPCYVDEAGNEYYPNKIGAVCCGCIVEANGAVH